MFKAPLSIPHIGDEEIERVVRAMRDGLLTVGSDIALFSNKLSERLGQETVVCSTGTAALHTALFSLGIGKDDEVIVPNISFIATLNSVIFTGAIPVLCEVGDSSYELSMNSDELERLITSKTKAILVTHLFGSHGDIEKLVDIARRHELFLIEDAAQTLGCFHNGKALGTFGDVGILSFNGNKIITSCGGGAITSSHSEVLQKVKSFINHSKDTTNPVNYICPGNNYRISNLQAAIGVAQLEKLEEHIEKKRTLHTTYTASLDILNPKCVSNYWMSVYRTNKNATQLSKELLEFGYETRPLYMPFNLIEYASQYGKNRDFSFSGSLFEQLLCLPSDISIELETVLEIIKEVRRIDK